jgi:hypothetical protein
VSKPVDEIAIPTRATGSVVVPLVFLASAGLWTFLAFAPVDRSELPSYSWLMLTVAPLLIAPSLFGVVYYAVQPLRGPIRFRDDCIVLPWYWSKKRRFLAWDRIDHVVEEDYPLAGGAKKRQLRFVGRDGSTLGGVNRKSIRGDWDRFVADVKERVDAHQSGELPHSDNS